MAKILDCACRFAGVGHTQYGAVPVVAYVFRDSGACVSITGAWDFSYLLYQSLSSKPYKNVLFFL